MILGCYCTKRFHDSYYLQRCTHLCLKNKPSKFKGVGTRKDKHKHCKSTLSVAGGDPPPLICGIRGIPQSGRLIIERKYKHCYVTINSLIFVLKLAAKLLCITKKGTAYI